VTRAERRRRERMRKAVELRAKGWSLRAIGAHLGVHHDTVREDLRRSADAQILADFLVGNPTRDGGNPTPESDSNVVQLRRKTG
jgi:lambda repressor-like predicted transcriptional regulator